MKSLNTKLLLSAFAVAMLATPALAQNPQHRSPHQRQLQDYAANEVILDGRIIGADPDANIRTQILRDWGSSLGE